MEKKVGIIGAGINGILACKYALSKGYQPIVFESRNTVGGVWIKTLETTKLQTPRSLYQFSDFPWPSSVVTEFPSQKQVLHYIQSYVRHFGLLKYIKFNTKVVNIKYESLKDEEMVQSWGGNEGKWIITAQDLTLPTDEVNEVTQVDFVVLCLGRFSDLPNVPEFPLGKGPEVFEGKVIHSMDYAAMDCESAANLVKGKRIVVVGFKKSALDIAMECSSVNGAKYPCTMICRTPRWNIVNSSWNLNRFSELMVHKPGEGPLLNLLAMLLSPLRWGISKMVEFGIKKKLPLKKFDMVPSHSFLQAMNSCMITRCPEGFYDSVAKGSIILKKYPSFSFHKEGILLGDHVHNVALTEKIIKSDLVIFATGFNGDLKIKNIFASSKIQDFIIDSSNQLVSLYRECIHPRIPQLAIIGFPESISNLYSAELKTRWLFELLDGKFELPSIEEMEKDILQSEIFIKKHSTKSYKRFCIGALQIWYNDQLCKDMGLKSKRKKGFWAEWFEPYGPLDYA